MMYYVKTLSGGGVLHVGTINDTPTNEAALLQAIGGVSITQAQYAQILANQYGSTFANNTITALAAPTPTIAQEAQAALTVGLTVNSTSTPAINGLYAIDTSSQAKIAFVSQYILLNGKFPRGQSSMVWVDKTGTAHTFPSTTVFQNWATAIADYVSELDEIILANSGTLPPSSVTIA